MEILENAKIGVYIRDLNGVMYELRFKNVGDFRHTSWENFDDEMYEILLVYWNDWCVYSQLQSGRKILLEDLKGFFA